MDRDESRHRSKEERRAAREDDRAWRRHRRRGRKERVLHTRVSDALADDIRRMADDLRVPASNLVRNVLEEVFTVVETVSDDVGELFEDLLDEADATRERIRKQRSRGEHRRHGRRDRRESADERARERELWRAAREEADEAEFLARPSSSASANDVHPAGPPPPPVDWHVAEDGRSVGPFRTEELAAAIRSGRVRTDSPVWCAGMSDWMDAGRVAALESLFRPPPPPTPPTGSAAPDASPAPPGAPTDRPDADPS
ncbi:MAG: DUF4339 domain-containing protein [Myxococcota bacterium]